MAKEGKKERKDPPSSILFRKRINSLHSFDLFPSWRCGYWWWWWRRNEEDFIPTTRNKGIPFCLCSWSRSWSYLSFFLRKNHSLLTFLYILFDYQINFLKSIPVDQWMLILHTWVSEWVCVYTPVEACTCRSECLYEYARYHFVIDNLVSCKSKLLSSKEKKKGKNIPSVSFEGSFDPQIL